MSQAEQLKVFLSRTPYVRFLGMSAKIIDDGMIAVLPFAPHLVGAPALPVIHGGVLGAFMEMTAIAQLSVMQATPRLPKTIDVTVEYLRSGRALTTWAKADVRKIGRRIANVHVEAWQDDPAQPIAALRGHFLMADPA